MNLKNTVIKKKHSDWKESGTKAHKLCDSHKVLQQEKLIYGDGGWNNDYLHLEDVLTGEGHREFSREMVIFFILVG